MDTQLAERYLAANGVPAFAVEDHSLVGYFAFGTLPQIHKPQVWVDKPDAPRAAELIEQYKQDKLNRQRQRQANEPDTIQATCEDCGKTSPYPGSKNGTVQTCPHCGSFIDVGEFKWSDDSEDD